MTDARESAFVAAIDKDELVALTGDLVRIDSVIRPEAGGVRIDPCIPKDWPGFTANRRFRGMTLHIEVKNPAGKNHGVTRLELDSNLLIGTVLPAEQLHEGARIVAIL